MDIYEIGHECFICMKMIFCKYRKKGENMKKLVKKALVLCLAFSMLAGTLSVPAAFVNDPSGFEVNSAAVKSENADIGESTEFVNDVQMRDQEEAAAGEIGSDARVRTVHRTESFLREATGLLQVPETEGSAEAQEAGTAPELATSDSAEGTDSTAVAEEDSDVVNVKNEAAAESNALEGENVAAAGQKPIETGSDAKGNRISGRQQCSNRWQSSGRQRRSGRQ